MIRRIWTAYSVELSKQIRLKQSYLGPVLLALVLIAAPWLHPAGLEARGAYAYIAYLTPLALNLLGFVLVLLFCAGLVAPEAGGGSLRMILTRPIRRHEYLIAKLLTGMTYAVLLAVLVAAGAWGMAWTTGGLTGVEYGGEVIHTADAMLAAYFMGLALALVPLWTGAAYALLVSTLTRSGAAAATAAVGVWILVDLVKYPLELDALVFTTYLESPWRVFNHRVEAIDAAWSPMAWQCLTACLPVFVGSVALAIVAFNRRNLVA